jgi:hypothetical protein
MDLSKDFGVTLLSFGTKVNELVDAGALAASNRLDLFSSDDEKTWY